uniref:Myosin motor domain-containing protein n=1 Tax=Glossina pallidipes TaxID=7398 RepID=A0A1A9ZNL4_GLOPL
MKYAARISHSNLFYYVSSSHFSIDVTSVLITVAITNYWLLIPVIVIVLDIDIDKISDREQFKETIQAMQVLGFDPRQISDILKILNSILHLRNITFANKYKKDKEELDLEGCDIYLDDLYLRVMGEIILLPLSVPTVVEMKSI